MDFKRFLLVLAFVISGPTNASTIFAPTDGTVNYINSTIDFTGGTTLVSMFNVGDLGGSNNAVVMNNNTAKVAVFSSTPPNTSVVVKSSVFSATVLDNMTLFGSDNFILGLSTDSGSNWMTDTGFTSLGGDIYNVHFSNGSILQIDVRVVPVPASVWLLGSGLFGLIGLARRKSA